MNETSRKLAKELFRRPAFAPISLEADRLASALSSNKRLSDALLVPEAVQQRKRIWELSSNLHCSIIGTCFSTAELRNLLVKRDVPGSAGATDHDLHGKAVLLAGNRTGGAKQSGGRQYKVSSMKLGFVRLLSALLVVFGLTGVPCGLALARSVTDAAGRVVEIPDQITHVMAAGPPASVILYTLVPEKMIGWVRAWKPDEARYIAPAYRHLPVIGRITGRGNTVTPEAVVKLAPDVIIDVGSVDSSYAELADRFQNQTGIPYVLLDGTLAASADTYRLLGQIVGEPERADALAKYATATLDEVRATLAQVPDGNPRASITAVVRMAWKPAWRGRSTWKCSRRSVR